MPPKTKTDIKKAEQDRLQAMIIEMLREEENKYCADCDAKQPRWASWNLGVFLCIRCAGIHRNLGVHLTKVKSVNLDSWTAVQVQSMRVMGNAKGRAVYEHALPKDFRRAQNDHSLESFIRAKYEQKRYIMKDWLPPRVDVNDLSLELKSERETKKVAATPKIPNGCAPSPKVESHSSPVQQQTKEIQLLDFSDSITVPSVPPTSQSNTDLFFNELTPKNTNSVAVGDTLDDIFGPVVSAPPVSVEENSSISNGFGDFSAFASASTSETAANNGQTQSVPSVASAPSLFEDLNGLNMGPPAPSQSAILTSATLSATDNSKKSNLDILALFGSSSQSPSASVCSQLSSLSGLNMTAPAPAVGSQFVSAPAVQSSLGSNNLGQFGGFGFGASQSNGMSAETAAKFAAASPFANQAKGFGSTAPTSDLLGGLSTQSTTMASSSANNFDFDFGGLTFVEVQLSQRQLQSRCGIERLAFHEEPFSSLLIYMPVLSTFHVLLDCLVAIFSFSRFSFLVIIQFGCCDLVNFARFAQHCRRPPMDGPPPSSRAAPPAPDITSGDRSFRNSSPSGLGLSVSRVPTGHSQYYI